MTVTRPSRRPPLAPLASLHPNNGVDIAARKASSLIAGLQIPQHDDGTAIDRARELLQNTTYLSMELWNLGDASLPCNARGMRDPLRRFRSI